VPNIEDKKSGNEPRCVRYVCNNHRINIPAYAIEQRWQSDVPKNEMLLMSLIFKNDARSLARRATMWLSLKNC
jgi:hypothetical protein